MYYFVPTLFKFKRYSKNENEKMVFKAFLYKAINENV